jgi:hypothetical protein
VNTRDFEYVENRLLAPAWPATEAVGRLRQMGHVDLADDLNKAISALHDECRAIRVTLRDRKVRER